MALCLYMDHNVRRPITAGLRLRGVDVVTAFEDGSAAASDPEILDRANIHHRVLYSEDADFLTEGSRRQREGLPFAGIVYGHQSLTVRVCIDDLELLAKASDPRDVENQIIFLPLH